MAKEVKKDDVDFLANVGLNTPTSGGAGGVDWRHISCGSEIPTETYSDQPYIVKTDDGAWLCVVTTGAGHEGQQGQHVMSMRSMDKGKTWSDVVKLESPDGVEASYAVMLKVPSGRVFCFYNHNTDDVRKIIANNPPYKDGFCRRVDSMGYYVFKYSDDNGKSWSDKRYPIPMRNFEIDNDNVYQGKTQFFWNVGKPFMLDDAAYMSVHKVGGFGEGFFTRSEGAILRSANILTEKDPEKITFETLPDGEVGLRAPAGGGPIAEEQSYSVLSDGSVYCVYRTVDGHPACCYSRDNGRTWSDPQYKRFADGRLMKHPRAATFAWKCENGKYLYWFHNHGGQSYEDRNPVWLCGGVEVDGPDGKVIEWTQPEVVIYDDDPFIRMSYPDLVEEDGKVYLTETQKDLARVHEVPNDFLEGIWSSFESANVAKDGLILSEPAVGLAMPSETAMPKLPAFVMRSTRDDYGTKQLRVGFSIDLWVAFDSLDAGQILLENCTPAGEGFILQTTQWGSVELVLNDGRTENRWDCGPGLLSDGKFHHICVIVDGGPNIISFMIDGEFCDGGQYRQFGWGRFSSHLRGANGDKSLRIGHEFDGQIEAVRIYNRALRTYEVTGNYQAGF